MQDPAADLAVAAALVSALTDKPVPHDAVAFGEVALSGELRPAGLSSLRLKEAAKLGFTSALVPASTAGGGALKTQRLQDARRARRTSGAAARLNAPRCAKAFEPPAISG